MKTHTALAVILLALSMSGFADTPAAILADFRAKAEPALAKVNATLEAATVPIIADLVKAGDTAGAGEVKAQLKAKQAGEPVMNPHAKAASLFTLYDAARVKALESAQSAAVARIEAMLKGSDGKKLAVVEELGKARAEIEAAKVEVLTPMRIPVEWTYHRTQAGPAEANVWLNPDGKFIMDDGGKEKKTGKWKPGKSANTLTINYAVNSSTWSVSIKDGVATVDRPDINETRYFKVKP